MSGLPEGAKRSRTSRGNITTTEVVVLLSLLVILLVGALNGAQPA